ncbi:hypothetical protein Ancab_022052 [Ancistrocladus abbreviatus]
MPSVPAFRRAQPPLLLPLYQVQRSKSLDRSVVEATRLVAETSKSTRMWDSVVSNGGLRWGLEVKSNAKTILEGSVLADTLHE